MALTVLGESVERRAAEYARRESLVTRLTADDATRRQREKKNKKRGVWAALAEAGIHLTQDQHHAVEQVLSRHPELAELVFSPAEAVERLAAYGVPFSDGQLELISDETTVSGLRAAACAFEDTKRMPNRPARRATPAVSRTTSQTATITAVTATASTVVTCSATHKRRVRRPTWLSWLRRVLAWMRARASAAQMSLRQLTR